MKIHFKKVKESEAMSSNYNHIEYIKSDYKYYMPDGSPAPFVMNAEDAIKFLRIDTNGTKDPEATLQYYINEGLLKPVTIGKCRKYPLPELLQFIDRLYALKENIS